MRGFLLTLADELVSRPRHFEKDTEALRGLLLSPADAVGVPVAPAYARETSQVRCDGPLGSPLMGRDASLGFRDLSLQVGDVFSGFADRAGDLAHRKPCGFQRLHGVAVLFELNPMPSDVAIAVSNHVSDAPGGRLGDLFEWLTIGGSWLMIG
jgi:hypothetical protein